MTKITVPATNVVHYGSTPKDRLVLVFGTPTPHFGLNVLYEANSWYTAYYDRKEEDFCINGGDWAGPFIRPLKWMELPSED